MRVERHESSSTYLRLHRWTGIWAGRSWVMVDNVWGNRLTCRNPTPADVATLVRLVALAQVEMAAMVEDGWDAESTALPEVGGG